MEHWGFVLFVVYFLVSNASEHVNQSICLLGASVGWVNLLPKPSNTDHCTLQYVYTIFSLCSLQLVLFLTIVVYVLCTISLSFSAHNWSHLLYLVIPIHMQQDHLPCL